MSSPDHPPEDLPSQDPQQDSESTLDHTEAQAKPAPGKVREQLHDDERTDSGGDDNDDAPR